MTNLQNNDVSTKKDDDVIKEELNHLNTKDNEDLWALCLSGGGIRSATFSLGVLQGLAKRKVLDKFHYMSTVSGGGYVGSWLSSWIAGKNGDLQKVQQELASEEPPQVKRLRSHSNYLSPVWGLSTDFFTLVSIFLRNLLLNWLVILPMLIAAVALPRFYLSSMQFLTRYALCTYVFGLFGLIITYVGIRNIMSQAKRKSKDKIITISHLHPVRKLHGVPYRQNAY